jgi:PncC family amidohydrolase
MNGLDVNKLFREYGRTLGSVESFTGGKFASEITKYSGASHFYKGGLVTYATEEKVRLLGIKYDLIDMVGVVSQEVAGEMAGHAKALLNVDYCVSFTGNAGPSAMEGKPVGEIYIGIAVYETVKVFAFNFSGTREEIQQQAIDKAIELLLQILEERK